MSHGVVANGEDTWTGCFQVSGGFNYIKLLLLLLYLRDSELCNCVMKDTSHLDEDIYILSILAAALSESRGRRLVFRCELTLVFGIVVFRLEAITRFVSY